MILREYLIIFQYIQWSKNIHKYISKASLLDEAGKTQVILVNFASCQFEEIEMIETRLT